MRDENKVMNIIMIVLFFVFLGYDHLGTEDGKCS